MMTRDILFTQLIKNLESGNNIRAIVSLICEHNLIAKSFTKHQLSLINKIFKNAKAGSALHKSFILTALYQRSWGGASAFISRLPFSIKVDSNVDRYFMRHRARKMFLCGTSPDCIDVHKITGLRLVRKLKNHSGKQVLPRLPRPGVVIYEIITKPANLDYYRAQLPHGMLKKKSKK